MVLADDRVLEYLSEEGSTSPKQAADSGKVRFTCQHINMRLKKLTEYGLTSHIGNGIYSITEQGEEYLAGELDAENLKKRNNRDL